MSDTDSILRDYAAGYEAGSKEREADRKKNLAEHLGEGMLTVATLGLTQLHHLGRSDAYEAGFSDGSYGKKYNPKRILETAWQERRQNEEAALEKERSARKEEKERRERQRPGHHHVPIPHDLVGCGIWFAVALLIVIAIWIAVVFSVITILVTMPVWAEAIAVSVITAFLYGRKRISEIGSEGLNATSIVEAKGRKRTKLAVDPAFLGEQLRFNPHLLIAGGSGVMYAVAVGTSLAIFNVQYFGKVVFGLAIIPGSLLAWRSGRKVLEWRIREAVLRARQLPATGITAASQIAFGLSCAASVTLLILIARLPAKPRDESRQQPTAVTSHPITQAPVQTNRPIQYSTPALPTHVPAVAPAIGQDPIQTFVDHYQNLEIYGSVSEVIELYAPTVTYFDNGQVNHDFIAKDKRDYRDRWIQRTEPRTGSINVEQTGEMRTVRFPTHFRVQDAKSDWIEGDADNVLQLQPSGSSFQIVRQDVQVRNRIRGNSNSTTSSTAVSAEAMSRFVNQLMELEKSKQLDLIMNNYASGVRYFDHCREGRYYPA